ncbi:MAG TPA: hypothetical protein VFA66_10570 [Gaiellaceae bacterium]|nr:hypothetical protein [Gaiellaceae bacterium]
MADLGNAAIGLPGGLVYSAEHPVGAAKQTVRGVKESVQHPLRHPGLTLLNIAGAKGVVGGVAGRTEAALAEARGLAGREHGLPSIPRRGPKPVRVVKAAVATPVAKRRTLTAQGPEGAVTVHPLGSRDYLTNLFQRKVVDRYHQAKLNRGAVVPGSHAIAEHVRLTAEESAPEVQQALAAIDRVHSAHPLDRRVTILHEDRQSPLGALYSLPGREGRLEPYAMQLRPSRGLLQMTTVHEAGHAVQKMAHGLDHHVVAAIVRSEGFKRVAGHGGAMGRYGATPEEGFARAYAQYIGERSRSRQIGEGIREFDQNLEGRGIPAFHWSREDFQPIAREFDRMFEQLGWRTKHGPVQQTPLLNAPDVVAKAVSSETKVGRELRAERRVEDARDVARVARLERFGKTRPARIAAALTGGRLDIPAVLHRRTGGRLTPGEQKALDVISSGATPEEHIAYHVNRLKDLAEERKSLAAEPQQVGGIVGKVAAVRRIRAEARNHRLQIAAARQAQQELANPNSRLYEAAGEARKAIRERERVLGLGKEEVAHRVGARQAEIQTSAQGKQSPLLRLDALEKQHRQLSRRIDALRGDRSDAAMQREAELVKAQTAIEDRIAGIHQDFIRRGKRAIDEGAFYVPSKSMRDLRRTPTGAGRTPSDYGVAPPRTLPELHHAYRGALQRTGNFRIDVTGLTADAYRRAQRWASVERGYQQLLSLSHATREAAGRFAIPIRTSIQVPQALKEAILKADQGTLTRADLKQLRPDDLEAFVKGLFPDARELTADQLRDVRWVDPRLAAGFRSDFQYGGSVARAVESFNAPFRASILYTKPAYAINLLQNLGTAAIRQGAFTPVNMVKALRLGKTLGSDDQHAIFSLVGEGLSRSLEAETGVGTKVLHGAGEWWNTVVDRYPRAAAWLHEARTLGYKTPDQIHALLRDDHYRADLVEVTRRANKEAVEYGQLTPFERNVVKRAIFFYPWIRGATLYSLRFAKEHPVQAAVYGNLGEQGHQETLRRLGRAPHYLEGSFEVGGRLVNPSNVNTFQTPVEVGQGVAGLFGPSGAPTAGDIVQEASPASAALYTLLSGKTTLGYELPSRTSRVEGAASQLASGLPEAAFFNRLHGKPVEGTPPSKRPIYTPGLRNALGKYLAGGIFPASFDKEALNARGEAEYRATLSPGRRVAYSAQQLRGDFLTQAKASGALPRDATQLPKALRHAISVQAARYGNYATLGIKRTQPDYQQRAFQADVTLLRKRGLIPAAEAEKALAWGETASKDDLENVRAQFGRDYFGVDEISHARHDLKQRGHPVTAQVGPP